MRAMPEDADDRQADRSPQAGHSIVVHIEELVLHGFAPEGRHRIARAVESELARLMSEEGLPGLGMNSINIERVRGGAFKAEAGARPQATGAEIARAVFRSVRQHATASVTVPRVRPGIGIHHP